eukprot:4364554-Prymnesium_polylepis.1
MPRVLTKKRPTACSGGSTLRSTFVDQRYPEGSTAALSRSRASARRLAHRLCARACAHRRRPLSAGRTCAIQCGR